MNCRVLELICVALLGSLMPPAFAAGGIIEKYESKYGFSSSDKSAPCEADDTHTIRSYIDSSIISALKERPDIFDDKTIINLQRIPKDIRFEKVNAVYINKKPTSAYFLPIIQSEYSLINISCKLECAWIIAPKCQVETLEGEMLLVYWNKGNNLEYVLKDDFELITERK